ncbi:unnamed protein product [Absidia cylindrospora]
MLTICLESNSLYLHGTPEESAGTEIRGCLELRFEEDTRIKSITLQFTGQLKLNWEEETSKGSRRRQCKVQKNIYQHDWTFLPERNWPRILKSNTTYLYPFDLVLPGHMAESISNSSGGGYGSLIYGFKATAARPFVRKNLVVQRAVHVIRQPLLGDRLFGMDPMMDIINDNINSMVIRRTHKDMVDYRIQLDKAMYQRGEPIRIHLTFKPLVRGLRVRRVSCFLKEYTTLAYPIIDDEARNNDITGAPPSSASSSLQHSQQSRIISMARNDRFPCYGYEWKQTETLIIPRCAQTVQYDTYHPLIRIQHKIRFTVSFVQPHGQVSELRVTMPINLLQSSFATPTTHDTATITMNENIDTLACMDGLPRYEDACLLAPYDPQQQLWSTRLTSPSASSLPSLVSPSYDDEETGWYHQQVTTPEDQLAPGNGSPPPSSCDYFSFQPSNPPTYIQHASVSPPA